MDEKQDRKCPKCGREMKSETRLGKAGTGTPGGGTIWNTGQVKEWVCECGYYERNESL
jgi:hypothetical protein